jgi:hypothetical protein
MQRENMLELVDATWHWLCLKHLSGYEDLLSEGALFAPIAEYIFGHRGKIQPEGDYHEKSTSVKKGDFYFDFAGEVEGRKFLLEAKFFKRSGHSRMFVDLLKLALPTNGQEDLARYMLVVWRPKTFDPGPTRQLLEDLKPKTSIEFEFSEGDLRLNNNRLDIGGDLQKKLSFSESEPPLKRFSVMCLHKRVPSLGERAESQYNVAAYSIERMAQ